LAIVQSSHSHRAVLSRTHSDIFKEHLKPATMMSAIAEKHTDLIGGLSRLYETLTAMLYIFPDDVVQPPHTPETISDDLLEKLGYESEAAELIRLLPFLRGEIAWGWQKDGTEILPRSKAVSYLIDGDSEWIDYLRWGDHFMSSDYKLLPPWMLRLTIGQMYPGHYGTDLIYDTKTRTVDFSTR
jgi:hypothetical protein